MITSDITELLAKIDNIDPHNSNLTATDLLGLNMFKKYNHISQIKVEFTKYRRTPKSVLSSLRLILFDWLDKVNITFRRSEVTKTLTEIIFDAFADAMGEIERKKVQAYGAAALLIASKLVDKDDCHVGDMVSLCAKIYTESEILDAEMEMLAIIDPNCIMNDIMIEINKNPAILNTLSKRMVRDWQSLIQIKS